ncbi:MAG: DUF1634 domain-containing protein [Myxococcales bacterium]|nr:DUF1634 domain-containing protein [Myxococcales bacterium]
MASDQTRPAVPEAEVEEPVRRFVQLVLRGGLWVSFALMAVGLVLALVREGLGDAPAVKLLAMRGAPSAGERVMAAGILVLALTPALRVVSLLVLWARERDWRFVGVAAVVVVVLAIAAALGR